MKKNFLFVLAAALMMAACSKQESIESTPAIPTAKTSMSNMRSYEEALRIAENAIGMLEDSKSSTRSTEKCRKINLSENKVIMRDAKTRGESGASDSLIYVFNFENNEGFALVSASKNTEGLLAVTEKGHFEPDHPSDIKGFDDFLSLAKEYVINAPAGEFSHVENGLTDIVFEYITVGPYLEVKWGQGKGKVEGELFSNKVAGCANIALGQIMTYYEYPDSIALTYKDADVSMQNLPWSSMRLHNNGNTHSETFLPGVCKNMSAHKAIARLIRQLGELNHSYPDGDETATTALYIPQTMNTLGYTVSATALSAIRSEIDNNHLMFVTGKNYQYLYDSHAWVMDGYKKEIQKERTIINGLTHDTVTGVFYYNHFNWGDYGAYNGYFSENIYAQSTVYWPDNGPSLSEAEDYKYNVVFRSIYR